MTLFDEIMNLPLNRVLRVTHDYKTGHRDARHSAAVISLKGDRAIDLLKDILQSHEDEQLKKTISTFLKELK